MPTEIHLAVLLAREGREPVPQDHNSPMPLGSLRESDSLAYRADGASNQACSLTVVLVCTLHAFCAGYAPPNGVSEMKKLRKAASLALVVGSLMTISATAQSPSDGDKKFLATASQSDVNEIKLSELAEQKATNPAVKAFATKMVSEHKKMSASMKPFAESWGLTAPTDLDEDHKSDYAKLNGLSGADFDKEYMDLMVSDHSKALDLFTDEAKDTKDKKFRAVVLKGKTMVAAHKNMAYDLKKKL